MDEDVDADADDADNRFNNEEEEEDISMADCALRLRGMMGGWFMIWLNEGSVISFEFKAMPGTFPPVPDPNSVSILAATKSSSSKLANHVKCPMGDRIMSITNDPPPRLSLT